VSSNPNPAFAEPLPRGRHKLSRGFVRESQRTRLLQAIQEEISERGYAATTVADVVARARVSRNAFYQLFADKEDCFLASCDESSTEVLEALYAQIGEETWTVALRNGLRIYLHWWQDSPEFAVAYMVDLQTAGRRALEQRDRAHERFAAMFDALAERARVEQPKLPPLPELATRLLVSGITELVGQEVRAGRLKNLEALEDELMYLIVKALADERTAQRAAG